MNLPDEIGAGFDVETVLADLKDCDTLRETFVAVVRQAAADLDEVSEVTGGKIPSARLEEKVDAVVGKTYFEVAERLGCNAVAHRVETVERLRDLDPASEAGDDLVSEAIRQIERG